MAIEEREMPGAVRARPTVAARGEGRPPIVWWALAGAVLLAFVAYVWIAWIAGPYFERVPDGPSHLPGWMATVQDVWQVGGLVAVVGIFWWFLARPWIRERRLATDGLLVLAFSTLWFQDPLSSYHEHWFTYNTHLLNFGAWSAEVPGWNSFAKPGAMVPEPILVIGPLYVYFILICSAIGCLVMRRARARWPEISRLQLIGLCFAAMCLVDLVAEGLIWLPLVGFWEYPGGFGLLFPSSYHKFPVNEMLTIGALMTAISSLRFFKDDRGHTFVERGVERIHGRGRQNLARVLAVTFFCHAALVAFYNVPNSWVGTHSRPWPDDLQKRSYFTDGLCGEDTGRDCPGPGVPLNRDKGKDMPAFPAKHIVPFDRGAPGGRD